MSQSYDPLKPTSGVTTFAQLYQVIRDHFAAATSNFSGTSFPANPEAGWSCWRTDRKQKYVYTNDPLLGESGWTEIGILSAGFGAEVANSRGTKSTLDQRLDVALNEDGTLKAPLTVQSSQWIKPYQAYLNYDTQTANFTVGRTITGGTSGATGVIASDVDNGATGTLFLLNVTGTFQAAETITDGLGGSALATGAQASAFEYVDATSFKVKAVNATDIYVANRRLKINLVASVVYASVASSSYGSGDTTVVVQSASAVLDNTLVDVEHSIILPVTSAADGGKGALSLAMIMAGLANGIASLDANSKVVQEPASKAQASGIASLDANSKVVQEPASKAQASGIASLDANSKVVQTALTADAAATAAIATTATKVTDGTNLIHTKIIDIGDWDMVNTASKNVNHTVDITKIRDVHVLIRNDDNNTYYPLTYAPSGSPAQGNFYITSTQVSVLRTNAGTFVNVAFDATSYNRGWIIITYID